MVKMMPYCVYRLKGYEKGALVHLLGSMIFPYNASSTHQFLLMSALMKKTDQYLVDLVYHETSFHGYFKQRTTLPL